MGAVHPRLCRAECVACRVCADYRAERLRQEIAWEDGGFRDDPNQLDLITFKRWLVGRPYPPRTG